MSAERDPAPDCIHHFSSKKGHHNVKRTRSDNQTLASHRIAFAVLSATSLANLWPRIIPKRGTKSFTDGSDGIRE